MLDRSEYDKRGYLLEDWRLFHLRDSRTQVTEYHYHEFSKLVFHLDGQTTYHVEGKSYPLQPLDILLVNRGLIHLPEISAESPYERMVLWIDPAFLTRHSPPDAELNVCFEITAQRGFHLYRPRGEGRDRYRSLFDSIEIAAADNGFAAPLLADTCMLQLMVALNRDVLSAPDEDTAVAYRFDPKMEEVTAYIMAHLREPLTIDHLAGAFYLSRYYLMHRFKSAYGCTVHQYILQKRLQRAAVLLRQGVPVQKAADDAGFSDYSSFLRAFRAAYGRSPREWK